MSKHTPGPWDVIQNSWHETSISARSNQIALIDAEVSFDVNEDNQDKCEAIALANANLIAAAPDLLEALELLIDDLALRAQLKGEKCIDVSDGRLYRAQKAIAKAKGEL